MQIYSSNGTRLNYLYFNVDDLSQDTARMDDFEELVYIRLFYQYLNKLALPQEMEKLKRIVRLRHATEEQVTCALEAFLGLDGIYPSEDEPDTIRYALWDALISTTIDRFDKSSTNGKNAANARWGRQQKEQGASDEAAA